MINRNNVLLLKILELYVDKDHNKFDRFSYEHWNPEKFAQANNCDDVVAQYHYDMLMEIGCFTAFEKEDRNAITCCQALSWTGHELLEALREGRQLQTVIVRLPECNFVANDASYDS